MTLPAQAGPRLGELLERHEAALDHRDADTSPLVAPEGVTLAWARALPPSPALLGRPVQGRTGAELALRGSAPLAGWQWRLGAQAIDVPATRARFDGSAVERPLGPGAFYVGAERRHWGPGWSSSLILDGAAAAVPAIGWRKTDARAFESRWLQWLGPWQADLFAGQLDNPSGPEHVKLIGMRVRFEPVTDLQIGLSRVLQWGGSGRDESPRSLLNALLGRDNAEPGTDFDAQPGNQLGGYDLRWTLRPAAGRSVSLYAQGIGEDEAGKLPSKFLVMAGVDAGFDLGAAGTARAFVETADTLAGRLTGDTSPGVAYRHPLYPAGYRQRGEPLGHPVAGDVRLSTLGLVGQRGAWSAAAMLHSGEVSVASAAHPRVGSLRGADLELEAALPQRFALGVALSHWREAGARQTGVQLRWRLPLR